MTNVVKNTVRCAPILYRFPVWDSKSAFQKPLSLFFLLAARMHLNNTQIRTHVQTSKFKTLFFFFLKKKYATAPAHGDALGCCRLHLGHFAFRRSSTWLFEWSVYAAQLWSREYYKNGSRRAFFSFCIMIYSNYETWNVEDCTIEIQGKIFGYTDRTHSILSNLKNGIYWIVDQRSIY